MSSQVSVVFACRLCDDMSNFMDPLTDDQTTMFAYNLLQNLSSLFRIFIAGYFARNFFTIQLPFRNLRSAAACLTLQPYRNKEKILRSTFLQLSFQFLFLFCCVFLLVFTIRQVFITEFASRQDLHRKRSRQVCFQDYKSASFSGLLNIFSHVQYELNQMTSDEEQKEYEERY